MKTETENRITIKLFVGCLCTSEIRMYLSQSSPWKQAMIIANKSQEELIQVHYQGKDYLGQYLDEESTKLENILKLEDLIKKRLIAYCPDCDLRKIKLSLFPQIFVR